MDYDLTRREFLEVSAAAAGLVAFSEQRSRVDLVPEETRTLHAMIRTLFRHPRAEDERYARATTLIAERCRIDATVFGEVTRGIHMLERQGTHGFAAASDHERVAILSRSKDGAFFRVVYAEALEALYGAPEAWRLFA